MGFGYLVLGSLVWLNPVYSGFTEWLAYTLILSGTTRLAPYGKGFKLSNYIGIPGLIMSIANFLLSGADILGFYSYEGSTIYKVIMIGLLFGTFALRFSLLFGVYEITTETVIDKLRGRAVYCIVLYATVFIFDFLQSTRIITPTSTGFAIVLFATLIIGLITFFLLFACLRMIVLEGDENDVEIPDTKAKKNSWWQKIKQMSQEDDNDNGNGGK